MNFSENVYFIGNSLWIKRAVRALKSTSIVSHDTLSLGILISTMLKHVYST
jgi:hypothetical protein